MSNFNYKETVWKTLWKIRFNKINIANNGGYLNESSVRNYISNNTFEEKLNNLTIFDYLDVDGTESYIWHLKEIKSKTCSIWKQLYQQIITIFGGNKNG